jgi:tetratricopeptide (TPR) repeat protein
MTDSDADREPLDVLAEEFAQRCRRGESPSISDYASRYPQWADQLQALLPPVAKMEECKRLRKTVQGPSGAFAPLARVGDYRLLREIGRGGMGIIYEAEQESLGRRVALKILPSVAMLDAKRIERFHREAQAAARLHHTNIVPVFGVGDVEGLPYYVMQLIDGSGLDVVLMRLRRQEAGDSTDGPLPLTPSMGEAHCRWVAQLGSQIAQALAYAHRQGVLHRDIKPANLLVDRNGLVWITDFGLAKIADQHGLTRTGDIVGTLGYLAPELLQGEADARSDVYSLGLTLYELLTLEPPFPRAHAARLLESVRRDEPVRPRRLNRAIPRALETIVLKAMAREPAHRYQTAEALAADLQNFLEDRQITARRANPGERLWRWCRRNRAMAGLAATALAAVLFAGVVGWIGYVKTQAALKGEARQTSEARAASERAEANVELSLAAFESMFNYITRRRALPARRPGSAAPRAATASFLNSFADDAVLLQSVLEFYERFAARNATNAQLQVEAAKAYRRIAELQQRLGKPTEAEGSFARALAILERVVRKSPSVVAYQYELAETYASAEPSSEGAEAMAQAEQRLRHALEVCADLARRDPDSQRWRVLLSRAEGRLGFVLHMQKHNQEAETAYRQSLAGYKALDQRSPTVHVDAVNAASIRLALADLLEQDGRTALAVPLLQEAIPELRTLAETHAGFRSLLVALAEHYQALAGIYTRQGQYSLAAEATRQAETVRQPRASLAR